MAGQEGLTAVLCSPVPFDHKNPRHVSWWGFFAFRGRNTTRVRYKMTTLGLQGCRVDGLQGGQVRVRPDGPQMARRSGWWTADGRRCTVRGPRDDGRMQVGHE